MVLVLVMMVSMFACGIRETEFIDPEITEVITDTESVEITEEEYDRVVAHYNTK